MRQFWLYTFTALIITACASGTKTPPSCRNPATGYYCVKAGDTLYRIGQRFGISVSQIKQWNNLQSDRILVGHTLQVSNKIHQAKTSSYIPSPTQTYSSLSLIMPVQGHIIRPYSSKNRGIDIAAPLGTPVHAAADGVVIYVGEQVRGLGKMVVLRHNNKILTIYANNDGLLVNNHVRVKTGQPIATVGNSGRTDGMAALHFEVRVNGQAVNPHSYFK